MQPALTAAILTGSATLAVLLALLAMRWLDRPARLALLGSDLVAPCIFLFRDGQLIDATAPAHTILAGCARTDLAGLRLWLAQRFDDLAALDETADGPARREIFGTDGTGSARLRLVVEHTHDGALRLTLIQPGSETAGIVVDSLSQQSLEQELALLRQVLDAAPMLITRRDEQDRIVWANSSYLDAAERSGAAPLWPLPEILSPEPAAAHDGNDRRARMDSPDGVHWFDCYTHRHGAETTSYALPADAEVKAEQNLREFLQTLTKTFADLPIGLAIFDRERHLQLFNPALIDLTGLPVGFVAARPSLYSVLDQLRELRMVPEPRDYRSWRRQISTLESAAAAGHHVETWSLPGGRTYRVTGRPHPDGAIAFLFEDITSEITLTRKFRADLALGMQVLDGLDQALIVFNAIGQVVMSNRIYADLWGPAPPRLADALQTWRGDWNEAPGLAELTAALQMDDATTRLTGLLLGPPKAGMLSWHVTPLPGSKRLLRFAPSDAAGEKAVPAVGDPERQEAAVAAV